MVLLRVLGVLLVVVGAVWLIQGLGIAPTGSFMDGQGLWAAIGAVCIAGGLVMLGRSRRRT